MSLSLEAVQADGFYVDPTAFDPSKRGRASANQIAGVRHVLGDRARRGEDGGWILTIRFELPHSCRCESCGTVAAQGTRYNVEKHPAGFYHSTQIWEFRGTCLACHAPFVIRTDPAARSYAYVSGFVSRQASYYDAGAGAGEAALLPSREKKAALATDAAAALEHALDDKRRAKTAEERLVQLAVMQEARWADDYGANKALRESARGQRRAAAAALAEGAAIGLPAGVPLLGLDAAGEAEVRTLKDAAAAAHDAARYGGSTSSSSNSSSGGGVLAGRKRALAAEPLVMPPPQQPAPLAAAVDAAQARWASAAAARVTSTAGAAGAAQLSKAPTSDAAAVEPPAAKRLRLIAAQVRPGGDAAPSSATAQRQGAGIVAPRVARSGAAGAAATSLLLGGGSSIVAPRLAQKQ